MKLTHYLTALLTAALCANAAPVVLYQTGWEAAPASPAWALGNVAPQNGWVNFNNAAAHQVVQEGTLGANIGGHDIVTPTGSQFHKFTANPSTTGQSIRYSWPDITGALGALPATHKIFKASMDVYVPATQDGISAAHGIAALHDANAPWGVLIDPGDLSVNILWDGTVTAGSFLPNAFELDTWFNVEVKANYNTGQITVSVNGVEITSISQVSAQISMGALTDIDLISWNWDVAAPALRSIASDNFLLTAEEDTGARPTLSIMPTPPDGASWTLSWPAAFSNWIVESCDVVTGGTWVEEGIPPTIVGNTASIEVADMPPNRFFRLRQPMP